MYEQLTSWDNLLLAYQKASRHKRGRWNVAIFEHTLEDQLYQLQDELRQQTYVPGAYHSFYIREPKKRLISAAPFRDRVVHHALGNIMEPIFTRSFIYDSYANQVGKGTHRALARAQQFARRYPYVLQADVRQFFPSIDHELLRQMLVQKIRDLPTQWLIDQILASGRGVLAEEYQMVYFRGDDLFAVNRARGLPIGNLTSQFWGNVYLNGFDHFVKRTLRCPAYVRYVDDFLLFAEDKRTLWQWKAQLITRLATLRLTIHQQAQPVPVSQGIPFLGFIVYPETRRLKRRCGLAYRHRLRRLVRAYQQGTEPVTRITASVRGWVNHARYGNTVGLRKCLFSQMPLRRYPTPPTNDDKVRQGF
jgi:RNA-directed DNA polymerase